MIKHLALRSDFPFIPESGSHLGGKGKILEPDLLLRKNYLLERFPTWEKKLTWRDGKIIKEGHFKNSKKCSFFLGLPNVFHISKAKGSGHCI